MNETEPARTLHPKKVGERIAEARSILKLELEDIAERSRIPLRHLQAIESSNFEALPASTYSIGFAKTFARMVGLDGDEIAADFRAERGETLAQRAEYTPFEPADPSRVPPRLLAMIAIGTAVILLIFYLVWRGGGSSDERQKMAAGTTAPEAVSPVVRTTPTASRTTTPAAAPAVSSTDKVSLTAGDKVWIKVSEKDGPTLFMGELVAGQSYEVPADAKDPRLLTGRPDVLQARIGPYVIPALGSGKRTIVDVSLKGPALIERETAMKAAANTAPVQPVVSTDRSAAGNADQPGGNVASPTTP